VALARPALARPWLDSGTLQPLFAISAPAAHPYRLLPHAPGGAAALFAQWLRALCADAQARSHAWISGLA